MCCRISVLRMFNCHSLALLTLLGTVSLMAQDESTKSSPLLGIAPGPFIAISVANLDRQIAWYRDTLGFTVSARGTVGDRKISYALLQEDTALLELVQWPGARPPSEAAPGTADPVEIHGFFKSGVVVKDVVGLYHHFQAQKITFDYELRQHSNGRRSFGLRDPEGNLLQLFGL